MANNTDQSETPAALSIDAEKDDCIRYLESLILEALHGQSLPIRLNQAEVINDIGIFAMTMARDLFSPCKWVQRTAKKHLDTLGINIEKLEGEIK